MSLHRAEGIKGRPGHLAQAKKLMSLQTDVLW